MIRHLHCASLLLVIVIALCFLAIPVPLLAQSAESTGKPCGCPDSFPGLSKVNHTLDGSAYYLYPYNLHLVSGARSAVPLQLRDVSGNMVTGSITFSGYDNSLISISTDGYVTAKRTEAATEIGTWVSASIIGGSVANTCVVRVLSTNYNLVYASAEAPNTILYYPTSINGENISSYVTGYEMAQTLDYAYKIERSLMGVTPFYGCKQVYEVDFGEQEAQRVCGISGNPIRIGWGAGGNTWQNCFLVPFIPPRSPQWGVMFHELGHNMTMISNSFYVGLGITDYIEGLATAIGLENSSTIVDGAARFPMTSQTRYSIAWVLNRDSTNSLGALQTWVNNGALLSSYTADITDGIWLYYRRSRPVDFGQRFFMPLRPEFESFVSPYYSAINASGDNGKHTFFAALVSAAVGKDLSSEFINTYHFPVVQALYNNLYLAFSSAINLAASNARPATTIETTAGNNQTGKISTPLEKSFVVRVTNADGYSVSGVSVNFVIAGAPDGATGQSLSIATTVTNSSGQALSVLTVGNKPGTYTVTAASSGLSGSPVSFTVTGTGAATSIALTAGNNQTAVISTALSNPFVVTVTDAAGSPISGASVNFAIASTPIGAVGQSLNSATSTTNISGQASCVLTLGSKGGTYAVTAASSGLSGSPVIFTATATAGAAKAIAQASGNSQTAVVSTALSNPFVVTVTDAGGNPVSGMTVNFGITSIPAEGIGQSLSSATSTTNIDGQASCVLTLGSKVGTYAATAASSGLSGSPVTFTATATAGAAKAIALASGNSQTAVVSTALSNPFVVTVTDAGGNPVSGVSVNFALASTPSGATGQTLGTTTVTSSNIGRAWTLLTLGNKPGTYTVTATSSGLSGSPITFSATASAGIAAAIASTSGNNQSGTIIAALFDPFVVTVTDAEGNPVSGVSVTFAVASTPTGATGHSLSTVLTTTNSSGQASSVLTLGNKAGTYAVTASSSGLSGSPVTFTATGTNPAPTLSSISTKLAGRGSKINLTITGTSFLDGVTTASFGSDVTVNSLTVISGTRIEVNITVSLTASLGARDVAVTNAGPGGGAAILSNGFIIDSSVPTSSESPLGDAPGIFVLYDAYPNPFNPSTTIRYQLPEHTAVSLRIYNTLGEEVTVLVSGFQYPGVHEVRWTPELPGGVYFYRLQAGSYVHTKKLAVLK